MVERNKSSSSQKSKQTSYWFIQKKARQQEMLTVGFVGWRGMVGSVLMQRMSEENNWQAFKSVFFSTSKAGGDAPTPAGATLKHPTILDAFDLEALATCDVLMVCQGGAYTKRVHADLRGANWQGYWIDASSALRMQESAVLVLDPLNRELIDRVASGKRDFIGANCTVSLMPLAIHGLLRANLVSWVSSSSYQAISGSGVAAMRNDCAVNKALALILMRHPPAFWTLTARCWLRRKTRPCRHQKLAGCWRQPGHGLTAIWAMAAAAEQKATAPE